MHATATTHYTTTVPKLFYDLCSLIMITAAEYQFSKHLKQ
jgi:hypothetical protein